MTNAFKQFWDAGYKRLVPITPPGVPVSEKSSFAHRPKALGKAPGVKGPDDLWRGLDWLKHTTTEADLDAWHAMGAGVGIRTGGGLVAVDIDTLAPEHAASCERTALEELGSSSVRIGNAPKRLLLYRTADTIPYQRVIFDDGLEHKPGAEARVELLSDDRQFVAHGTHPVTGQPYRWEPHAHFAQTLTPVTAAQVDAFFQKLATFLPAAAVAVEGSSAERGAVDQAQLAGAPDTVAKAVAALPNDGNFPDREAYIRVGHAIKGATLDDEARGLELFQEWAARWTGGENDPDVVEADWSRMRPPFSLGAQYLYELAQRHSAGAFVTGDAWFSDAPNSPPSPFDTPTTEQATVEPIKWMRPSDWQGVEPPPREWEVEGWIPRREVTLLYGDGGIGKTLLAHQYATAAAAGVSWLGQKTRQAKVMCFFCEDGEDELHRRQIDVCKSLGIELSAADDRLRIASRKYMDNLLALWSRNSGAMQRTVVWEQLLRDAVSFGAEVIIVDTLADTFGGSEIDRAQVNAFVKSCLGRLAQAINGSVIALGHPSVAGKGEGRSGSTAWSNAARSRLFLRYPKGVEKGNVRELEGMKLNYGPKGALLKLQWKAGAFAVLAESRPIDLNAFKSLSEVGGVAVASVEGLAAERVLAALRAAEIDGQALNLSQRSSAYAPRVLKRLYPDGLDPLTLEDIDAAIVELERAGTVRASKVSARGNRHPVSGYAVVAALQGGMTDKMSATAGNGVFQ
jgi:hypothetical protein